MSGSYMTCFTSLCTPDALHCRGRGLHLEAAVPQEQLHNMLQLLGSCLALRWLVRSVRRREVVHMQTCMSVCIYSRGRQAQGKWNMT